MKRQRDTRQRHLVLEAVRARHDHPTADHIYMDVRAADAKISRSTVYRNLNLLSETGEIRRIKVPGVDRFDWRKEPHYHLLCTRCDKVSDAPLPYNDLPDRTLEAATGYSSVHHRQHFEGICPDCLQKPPVRPE